MPEHDSEAASRCDRDGCDAPMTVHDAWGRWCDEHEPGNEVADSTAGSSAAKVRYEVGFFIGPCKEDEMQALVDAIIDLPEYRAVGSGGVGVSPAPSFAEEGLS